LAPIRPAFQSGDNTVTMDLNEQNVTCTFVNEQQPPCWAEICVKKVPRHERRRRPESG